MHLDLSLRLGAQKRAPTFPSGDGDGLDDLPAEDGTIEDGGGFTFGPVKDDNQGALRLRGKNGGLAKFIFDIGVPVAGQAYIMRYDPDFSLLSNTGKDAFVGFRLSRADERLPHGRPEGRTTSTWPA